MRISCAGKREATSALPRLTPPSDTQASVSTVVFLLPPRSEAVHDHQRVLRTVFTIKAFFQEKSNRSFQSQEAASRPSPSLPFGGSSPGGDPTRYPRNSATRPSASPTRFSSWAEGSPLLAGHMILRSFRADSRLFTFQMLMPPSMPVVQNWEHLAFPPLSTEIWLQRGGGLYRSHPALQGPPDCWGSPLR